MERRLLVTGGSGFIGRHVIPLAIQLGYQVLNVDLREPKSLGQDYKSVVADIRDGQRMAGTFEAFSPTHVLHLASDTDISLIRFADFTTVTNGSHVIFNAAAKQPSVQRLVHVSTQYVVEPGIQPEYERQYKPYTVYGEAKAESEKYLWASDLDCWTIVRPTIVWGPYHPTFADQLWKYIDRRVYLHPSSRKPIVRSYGYVENVAEQMVRMLGIPADQLGKKVYYLGDMNVDYGIWTDAFARALTGHRARRIPRSGLLALAVAGEGLGALGVEFPFNLGRFHRMTTASSLDLNATFESVGLPPIDFETGVERTVAWLRQYWSSQRARSPSNS